MVATWRGKPQSIDELATATEDLSPAAIALARSWSTWAAPRGYRVILSDSGRVVLVFSRTYRRRAGGKKEDNTVERFLRSVERTIAEVDQLIPREAVAGRDQPVVVVGARCEDYADGDRGSGGAARVAARMGQDRRAGSERFHSGEPAGGRLGRGPSPTLRSGTPRTSWVHRVATELILRHADLLPTWLQIGLVWHVEDRVMRSIYCFPYRTEFVSIYDHTDWHTALMQMFKRRAKQPMELTEVAEWNLREGYQKERGYLAFGVGRYLAEFAPDSIAPALAELSALIGEKRKIKTGEYSWRTDPDYRLPIDEQLAVLRKHAGDGLLTSVTTFFRKGKRYRPASARSRSRRSR